MLGKLMKHELRATGRVMLPVLGVLVLLAALSGISAKILDSGVDSDLLNILSVLFITAFVLGLFAAMVLALVLMIQRFYKNLMGDEGYLMFTLPAGVDAHIFSKLFVSFIWFAATAVICVLSLFIMMSVNVSFSDMSEAFVQFGGMMDQVTQYVSGWNILGYFLEFLVLCFVGSCATCLHFYAAIAAGHSFSNHKVLLSVVFYFVLSFLLSIFNIFMAWVADKTGLMEAATAFMDAMTPDKFVAGAHVGMLCVVLYGAVMAAVCYLPTTLLLKKRLNLA